MKNQSHSLIRSISGLVCLFFAAFFLYSSLPRSWFSGSVGSSPVAMVSQELPQQKYITKNIEDIEVGELVFAYDVTTGETVQRAVTDIFERRSDHIRFLTVREFVSQTVKYR